MGENFESFFGGAASVTVICLIIGLALIVTEIFRQTKGIIGAIGMLICLAAVVFNCVVNPSAKDVFVIVFIVALVVNAANVLKLITNKRAWLLRKPNLSDSGGSSTDTSKDYYFLLNLEGVAITDIKNSGRIMINEVEFDVINRGEPIAIDSRVKVVEVEGRRIVVRQL